MDPQGNCLAKCDLCPFGVSIAIASAWWDLHRTNMSKFHDFVRDGLLCDTEHCENCSSKISELLTCCTLQPEYLSLCLLYILACTCFLYNGIEHALFLH